jgi:hypothetical protein
MLTTPHALIGALIILKTQNPIWGFFLAFLSHFIFDFFVPHWNPHIYTEKNAQGKISKKSFLIIITDILIANLGLLIISLSLQLNLVNAVLLWIGAFFAVIPDLIEAPYYFFDFQNNLLNKYIQLEHNHQLDAGPFWGVVTQLITLTAVIIALFNL